MAAQESFTVAPGVSNDAPFAIAIMGPTATGKTGLAIELIKHLPCEIISVDSTLVYRGMNIGSAKPTAEELAVAPHHLIDIREPQQTYSAADFRHDCLALMNDITSRGKIPLLVGGTMLYYKALQEGLSPLPSADQVVRKKLEAEALNLGRDAMHDRLMQVDPVAAERIHKNDPQRIQRALEIYEITGRPMSALWAEQESEKLNYQLIKIVLFPQDRSVLHQRIETRFKKMLEQGFLQEVEDLKKYNDVSLDLSSMRSVGYRQALEYLEGQYDYPEMIDRGVFATRQLAKRQITWLRKEQNANFYDPDTLKKEELLQNLKYSLSL
ncbi:MAG: tRNA (adenosine(37)-N6)-dimethylallyltransferase MiaA [Gammaproteobacteria bacterium]|nr:tRNA (adenosine(37)-N6)-dimethylallyltransferase MiaA [Gammaproteobacteria bacterium]